MYRAARRRQPWQVGASQSDVRMFRAGRGSVGNGVASVLCAVLGTMDGRQCVRYPLRRQVLHSIRYDAEVGTSSVRRLWDENAVLGT